MSIFLSLLFKNSENLISLEYNRCKRTSPCAKWSIAVVYAGSWRRSKERRIKKVPAPVSHNCYSNRLDILFEDEEATRS